MGRFDLTTEEAEIIAFKAMAFIAGEDARLSRFLALTGADPEALANDIRQPAFQAAILDHLMSDESLLLVFCETTGIEPELPRRALRVLQHSGSRDIQEP